MRVATVILLQCLRRAMPLPRHNSIRKEHSCGEYPVHTPCTISLHKGVNHAKHHLLSLGALRGVQDGESGASASGPRVCRTGLFQGAYDEEGDTRPAQRRASRHDLQPRIGVGARKGINPESLTEERMLDLVVEEPRYWKRPVAIIDSRIVAGGNAKTLAAELGF